MTAIRATDLSKRYGTLTAVDRVDLTVEEGEIFGFLGHNGAGKSTMINMLLDFVRPTTGRVEVFGIDCQERSVAARTRMGVLPEGYAVYESLTGRQHVQFAMESKGVEGEPLDFLDRVGITDAADRKAGGYSKGMAQRMVLAMALVGEPDLLVLDEPTSGLDPNGAKAMREIIQAENERGATVFFSSHILEQVEAICDRVGIMHRGELAAVDTIDSLRETAAGGTKLLITVDAPLGEAAAAAPGADVAPDMAAPATATTDGPAETARADPLETVGAVDGVEAVWVDDPDEGRIGVTCTGDVKMDVLVALHERGVDVVDFSTEEPSLEDLFVQYTGGA